MMFSFKNRSIECNRTLIVGILNVTPDSFSDGGAHFTQGNAVAHAIKMLDDGADIIDIGGESSRPGAEPVSEQEEIKRIIPVIEELRHLRPELVISVDTTKSFVAEAALEVGADIINDISALRNSQALADTVAKHGAGIILMHMRGTPATMRDFACYDDLIAEICAELKESVRVATDAGIAEEKIIIDPGIGFAKNSTQSLEIVANARRFTSLGHPMMMGHSRKSFLGDFAEERVLSKRISATVATTFWLVMQGVNFVRVHDVAENLQAVKMAEAIRAI